MTSTPTASAPSRAARARSRRSSDAGHDPNANIFTSIVAHLHRQRRRSGAAQALTGQDDAVLHTRRKRAEHNAVHRPRRRLHRGRRSGRPGGGHGRRRRRQQHRLHRERRLRLVQARSTSRTSTGSTSGSPPAAPAARSSCGWTRRPARRSPRRTWPRRAAGRTGRRSRRRSPTPPAGTHELFLVFTHPTDAGGLFNLNWFQVHGKGAVDLGAARGHRHGHAGDRPGAARRSRSTRRRPTPRARR